MVDIKMKYEDAIKLGFEDMLNFLNTAYPERKLYSISKDWFYDNQYIAKAKGISGDVVISWL